VRGFCENGCRVDGLPGSRQGCVKVRLGGAWVGGLARPGGAQSTGSPWTSDSYSLGHPSRQLVCAGHLMYPPRSCPNPCPYLCPAGKVSAPSAMYHCLPSDTSWSAVLYGLPPLACMPPRTVAPAAACLHQSLCSAVGAAETFCTGLGGWRRVRQDASGDRDAAVVVWWRGALCVCAFGGWWRQAAQKVDG